MAIYNDVRLAIKKIAEKATSAYPTFKFISSHGNGSEPAESYGVYNILSIEQQGHSTTSTLTREDETLDYSGAFEVMVQFSFLGSQAGEIVHVFTQRINSSPWVLEEQNRNKLGFMRKSSVRRAPQKRDTQWIEAFNVDVTFLYIVNTNELVDVIESVVILDEITGEIYTVPPNITIP